VRIYFGNVFQSRKITIDRSFFLFYFSYTPAIGIHFALQGLLPVAARGFSPSAVTLFLSLFCLAHLHPTVNESATGMSHLLSDLWAKNILLNQHPLVL